MRDGCAGASLAPGAAAGGQMNSRLVAAGDGVVVDIAVGAVHESDTAVVGKKSTIADFATA